MFKDFKLEPTTVWSFPERGKWATQKSTATYRGNFAPQVARNLILRYTKRGEVVLDPFVGSGTTLVECKILGRKGIGVDINQCIVELCKNNLNFETEGNYSQEVIHGDARNLDFLEAESVDLIIAHPPYANAIKYSTGLSGDLSLISEVNEFIREMEKVANELFRVLKFDKYCTVVIGDLRRDGSVIPLGFKTLCAFQKVGFALKEIIVKIQHNCKSFNRWNEKSIKYNFLLLAHEYIFAFLKTFQK